MSLFSLGTAAPSVVAGREGGSQDDIGMNDIRQPSVEWSGVSQTMVLSCGCTRLSPSAEGGGEPLDLEQLAATASDRPTSDRPTLPCADVIIREMYESKWQAGTRRSGRIRLLKDE